MKYFKKLAAAICAVAITLSVAGCADVSTVGSLSVTAFAENDDEVYDFDPNTDKIYSEAVYMVNTDTGDVVYKKNESKKMYPASTTKIMTCIIALEHLSEGALSKKVEVPYDCFNDFYEDPNYSDPSNAAIEPLQDNLTYKDCLYALMLPSACEAANILAYNIGGGSITKFIGMMNEKAKELGCTGTNFVNAHGLHNDNNYTTAEDLYKMTKYAYDKFPLFKKITSTYEYEMPKNDANPSGYSIYSTISLLRPGSVYEYEYAYGTKTGTTDEAGRCLVSAAKNQYNYILVTLGAPVKDKNGEYYDDWYSMIDALNLYKWAFTNFEMATVVNKDEQITEVKVEMGESATHVILTPESDYTALMPKSVKESGVQKVFKAYESVQAPVKKGDILGVMDVKFKGETITTMNLVANNNVARSDVEYYIEKAKDEFDKPWFKVSAVGIVVLLICFIVTRTIENSKRRKLASKEKRRFESYAKRR